MRLETPVLYVHAGDSADVKLDVSVEFRGGWLTQFYPEAEFVGPGNDGEVKITPGTRGSLAWKNVALRRDNPKLPEQIIRAHAEAIKRFYDDKAFAVKTYIAYDKQPEADVARIYDLYAKGNIFDRVPFVLQPAVKATNEQQVDPTLAKDLKSFDFKRVIDNSVVSRLVKEGYFQQLFGPGIKAELDQKARTAFR
jgi:hypothetical protein